MTWLLMTGPREQYKETGAVDNTDMFVLTTMVVLLYSLLYLFKKSGDCLDENNTTDTRSHLLPI